MISFWAPAAGTFGIERWLEVRAPEMASQIRVCPYESLTAEPVVTTGAHIFAGLDQLGPVGNEAITALYHALQERCPGDRLLNHPATVARRFELLTRAFDAGINSFRAFRAGQSRSEARYPVFVREEARHGGPLTGLLRSRRELTAALHALRARGHRMADLLIIEFCELSDQDGVFRTAAAMKVGDRILPTHMLNGRHWVLNWDDSDHEEQAMREFDEYVRGNAHMAWLRRVFALAGVDYGRIDYGVKGETLQVWEINLNATIGPGVGPMTPLAPRLEAVLQAGRKLYNGNLAKAFRALDPEPEQERVALRLDPALIARMQAEMAGVRRRGTALGFLRGIYHHPRIGWPFRTAYSWLWPRR